MVAGGEPNAVAALQYDGVVVGKEPACEFSGAAARLGQADAPGSERVAERELGPTFRAGADHEHHGRETERGQDNGVVRLGEGLCKQSLPECVHSVDRGFRHLCRLVFGRWVGRLRSRASIAGRDCGECRGQSGDDPAPRHAIERAHHSPSDGEASSARAPGRVFC